MNQQLQSKHTGTSTSPITTTILFADAFDSSGLDSLRALGHTVIAEPSLKADDLAEAIATHNPSILVVRSTKVQTAAIEAGKKLELIVRAGAGTDTIDIASASRHGVFVCNCPGRNSIAVAELAWGLILSCDRRIPDQTADLRAGVWRKKEYSKADGLHGRTLGIVGLGQIGREIADRGRAFGMQVIAWSRSLDQSTADQLGINRCESLLNLMRMADVVSINVAATQDTAELINRECLEAMKPGSILVNTSRGSVLDQAALADVVKTNGIRSGLDVFANEPPATSETFEDSIVGLPGVYGTHHVGASTEQAQKAIADLTIEIIRTHLESGETINCVNLAHETGAAILTVRHYNLPGVLAHVFDLIGRAGINVEEMSNVIYAGGDAACAKIRLSAVPTDEQLDQIRTNEHVLAAGSTGVA
jgi:D-3-phosphoglycerate dehydrogenase